MISPDIEVVENKINNGLDEIVEVDIVAYLKNIGSMDLLNLEKKLKAFNCKLQTKDVIKILVEKNLIVFENELLVIK